MKTIVILGASYGGVSTAHRILKQNPKADVKIILVSTTTHLYWNLASVRAIIPGQFADEKIFQPIAPGFKQYPASKFEFVIGTAESFDVDSKKVSVASTSGNTVLNYDILILATGSSAAGDAPFKGAGSYEATLNRLHAYGERVKQAKTIVVVGAGPTGVEVSGELGFEYGTSKKVTLIASGAQVLTGTPASVSKTALKQLQSVHVSVKLETKVTDVAKSSDGRTELTLSDGSKITTDLYLPTTGLKPNSSYVPASFVDRRGFVMVDEYLRVKGAKDVWAVGDIADIQRPQYMNTDKQSVHLAKNIGLVLNDKAPEKYKIDEKDMLAIPVGRKQGTGHMGTWKLPSFMVNFVKGKTLFTEKLPSVVTGSGN